MVKFFHKLQLTPILTTSVYGLSVVQWQDSMQILPDHYLDLSNSNQASLLTDEDTALKQTFSIDLNDNFINTLFDVIVFDPSDQEGLRCYQRAVQDQDWDAQCRFASETQFLLNQSSWQTQGKGLAEIEALSQHVVIDNTPLPKGGAYSRESLIAMMSVQTEFTMTYNVKSLTIYCGLGCLFIVFVIFGLLYMQCKLRNVTNAKLAKLYEESEGRYGKVE